ncbi:glycosyltransferase, partial [Candidatus Saccharibacteria bacterium]|nr:glycosyltransferase [Candidatus Saccharibacteria bacterium]
MPTNQSLDVGLVFDDSLDKHDGVAQYVKTLGAWLSDQGHNVSYFVGETKMTDWQGGNVYSLARNQTVYFNGNKLSMPLRSNKRQIKEVLAKQKLDVLHVMVPYSPFMAQKIINLASPQTAIVGTFHIYPSGNLSIYGSKLLRLMLRGSLEKFQEIMSVSQASADFASQTYNINPRVVPNPVDIKSFSKNHHP